MDYIEYDGKKFYKSKTNPNYYYTDCYYGTRDSRKKVALHKYIWTKHNGEIPKGYVIHHKDGNPQNNNIENLIILLYADHQKYHMKLVFSNPNYKEENRLHLNNARIKASEWHKSKEGLDWHRINGLNQWTPEKRELKKKIKLCQICGKEYVAWQETSRFCSKNCIARNWRRTHKS